MECLLTIIEFIFINEKGTIKESEIVFKFELQNEKFKLNKKNQIKFQPKCPKSKIYYGESITLFHNQKELCTFQFLIYINKKNIIIVDLDESNKPSFELFFYTKESKYNPTILKYKEVEYNQFVNYGNKYRSRIFFANVEPTKLEYINSHVLDEYKSKYKNNTYQAIFRIVNQEKFEVSLTDMQCYVYDYNDMKYEQLSNEILDELRKLLLDFDEKFLYFISNDINSFNNREVLYNELKESSEKITTNKYYYFLNEPNKNEYNDYSKEILFLFHIDYFLNEFIELDDLGFITNIEKFNSIEELISEYHSIEYNLYKKLTEDNNLDIEQKIKILKTITLFFKRSLRKKKSILGVNYINMKTVSINNPYFKSRELLYKIVSELTEDSRLFEAFLYFDSEVIENILTKNTAPNYTFTDLFGKEIKIDLPQYMTEYGISLMTINEIKDHLFDLLPTIIIQIDVDLDMRAMFENETKIMIINEYIMFGICSQENEEIFFKKEPDYFVIPISMEILHELFGHEKIRYKRDISEDDNYNYSPLVVRDSKNDFYPQRLIKKIKLFDEIIEINKGETGRVLEHYISKDPEIIRNLKRKNYNKELINSQYWSGKNFDLLHKIFNCEVKKGNALNTKDICYDQYDDEPFYHCVI